MGGLLTLTGFLEYFPQLNVDDPPPGWSTGKASNVQGTMRAHVLQCSYGITIWAQTLDDHANDGP